MRAVSSSTETPTETTTVAAGETTPVETAGANPTVGGAEMLATKNIVENASASPIHKTLVAAVTQAGLVETLSGAGPFTVFRANRRRFLASCPGDARWLDASGAEGSVWRAC